MRTCVCNDRFPGTTAQASDDLIRSSIPAEKTIAEAANWLRWIVVCAIILCTASQKGAAQSFGSLDSPQTNLVPIGPPPASFSPGSTGNFDPYATTPGASSIGPPIGSGQSPGGFSGGFPAPAFPSTAPPGNAPFGGLFSQPASSPFPSQYGAPAYGSPPPSGYVDPYAVPSFQYDNSNVYGAPPTFPNSIYPSSRPTTLFPEGMFGSGAFAGFGGLGSTSQIYRGPRFRHTFVGFGDSADDLNVNDTDVSLVLAWENFLWGNQPLYIVPSFSLHLWDGPETTSPGSASSRRGLARQRVQWVLGPGMEFRSEPNAEYRTGGASRRVHGL